MSPGGPPPPPALVPQPPAPPRSDAHLDYPPYGTTFALPRPRPILPPVTDAVLRIPLRTGELVRESLDLLTRRDTGLRGASFYIGFMLLVTVAPLAVIFGLGLTLPIWGGPGADLPRSEIERQTAWFGWAALAALPAFLGYLAAGTDARSLATAVIGGRVEGRPLGLRESIAVARRRFWSVLGAQVLIGLLSGVASAIVQLVVVALMGPVEPVTFAASLLVSLAVSWPFAYVPAGIVLGEVGALEAISRSIRLVGLRKGLAVVITLFGVLGQFIVLFGLSEGLDLIGRVLVGAGVVESFPRVLVVPIAAALVFALGTLTFLVEAIAAAPAVHAFAALTHYTHGLQEGRDRPVAGTGILSPWVTPGLALAALLALLAVIGAVLTLPV